MLMKPRTRRIVSVILCLIPLVAGILFALLAAPEQVDQYLHWFVKAEVLALLLAVLISCNRIHK